MSSIIMPAGGKQKSWLDNISKGTGTSSIPLKELKRLAQFSQPEEDVNVEDVTVDDNDLDNENVEVSIETAPETEVDIDTPIDGEVLPPVGEDVEVSEEADVEEGVDDVEVAIDAAKTALDDVEIAVEQLKSENVEEEEAEEGEEVSFEETPDEVEIELDSEPENEVVDVEVEDEAPDDDNVDEEVKEASSSKFYKIASLSPDNRKKLADYWVKSLGYDKDYVKMMLKDYDK